MVARARHAVPLRLVAVPQRMQFVRFPLGRIVLDVFADMVHFAVIANDVLPIIALP